MAAMQLLTDPDHIGRVFFMGIRGFNSEVRHPPMQPDEQPANTDVPAKVEGLAQSS